MRHRKKFNHLGRKKGHRSSMLANMACSLIEHKRINTTLAKAKALKKFVEPLITKSKSDTTHNRRIVFSRMKQKNAVAELFRDVAVKVADRPGGYTRIIRLGNRLGDNAEMAMIELVDYNDTYVTKKKKTTRRSRRGKKSESVSEEVVNEEIVNDTLEAPAEEAPAEEAAPVISDVEKSPASIVSDFEKSQLKENVPSFRPGDTVSVSVKVKDGQRTRLQAFEGVVMSVRNSGLNSSFIVRKISSGIGVERTFQLHSPLIDSISVKRKGDVRKAKLFYLRERSGKSARIKERLD